MPSLSSLPPALPMHFQTFFICDPIFLLTLKLRFFPVFSLTLRQQTLKLETHLSITTKASAGVIRLPNALMIKKEKQKKQGGLCVVSNYSAVDLNSLLYFVKYIKPISANQ